MTHEELFKKFINNTRSSYPGTLDFNFESNINLISNLKIQIKKSTFKQITEFIKLIFKLSRTNEYSNHIKKTLPQFEKYLQIENFSTLMSYDFHITDDSAKLIEVNTNASSFLIGNEISKIHNQTHFINKLKKSFENEMQFSKNKVENIVIIDENPTDQPMYLELLMYCDLFKSWGYNCNISDFRDLQYKNGILSDSTGNRVDFIYNRYCDFYLTDPSSTQLLNSYTDKACIFSPQPKEYLLLADKERMIEWSNLDFLSQFNLNADELNLINKTLIPTQPIADFDKDTLWSAKKSYFFKPANSFGGKSVYRGKSLTKKTFERLLQNDTLVQKYVPAPTIVKDEQKWKYDIRVYCYKDEVQQILARCYQGQVTNLQTLGGGLTAVDII